MASRTRHSHRPSSINTTPFRRAARSLESWVLSDFGRLSMTSRSRPPPPILHQQLPLPPTYHPPSWPISSSSSSSSPTAASVTPFPQPLFPPPSYAPPAAPRGYADWTPVPCGRRDGCRSRQRSASSATSTSMSSVASSTSSFGSSTEC